MEPGVSDNEAIYKTANDIITDHSESDDYKAVAVLALQYKEFELLQHRCDQLIGQLDESRKTLDALRTDRNKHIDIIADLAKAIGKDRSGGY
jgi:hypothetical protein